MADSSGRRNTSTKEVAVSTRRRRSDRCGRGALRSPGRPSAARREDRRQFWVLITAVDAERDVLVVETTAATPAPAAMLLDIKGIGPEFAAVPHSEGLFRHFANRRQLAAYAGLAPSPWKSGSIDHEQGVSKA